MHREPFALAAQFNRSYQLHIFDDAEQAKAYIASKRLHNMRALTSAHGRRLRPDVDHRGEYIVTQAEPAQALSTGGLHG